MKHFLKELISNEKYNKRITSELRDLEQGAAACHALPLALSLSLALLLHFVDTKPTDERTKHFP